MMSIGTKIRKLRQDNNKMSQEELAYKLGIAQTSISNIESDKNIPDFLLMEKICNLFNVDLDYFSENRIENWNSKKNDANKSSGEIENPNNNRPEGILENIIKRLEKLETLIIRIQIKLKRIRFFRRHAII